ncbi:MAG TPA: UDP-glucose/GDP-mannose dehydrogenase family protein [Devosia sp.]
MKIAMIGAGYVGLTTGACLADLGHGVVCVDVDRERVAKLEAGHLPIYEPGLDAIIARNRRRRRLSFSSDLAQAVAGAEAIFLAVGTPSRKDGSIDLSYIERAARQIAKPMRRDAVVVVKSTVVAGTARRLREIIAEARGGLDFSVASNPEFLREGSAVEDFMCPDRIVIGADDPKAAAALEQIYGRLIAEGASWLATSTTNAEMIKYAANSLLALKIGFINEVADLCEAVGGDVGAVAKGIGLDRRIGSAFLAAGPGFGGSCFPKDTRAFAALGRQRGAPQRIVETLIDRNDERKEAIARRMLNEIGSAPGKRIALLGVAFKANTDDVRDSAALSIAPVLQRAGCAVAVHDPKASTTALLPGVAWCETAYEAADGADLVAILTDWDDYRELDLDLLRSVMAGDTLFDCRNLFDPEAVGRRGLRYFAIGRGGAGFKTEKRTPGSGIATAGAARVVASPA